MKNGTNGNHAFLTSRLQTRITLAIFSVAVCIFAVTTPTSLHGAPAKPAPAAKGDAKAGEQIFQQKCYQCHSVAEGEMRVGPSLYHELKKPKPKKTDAEARLIIKNGKNKMPAWGAILSAEDTDNILAYLHTL